MEVCEAFALGLRLGIEVQYAKAKFSESLPFTDVGGTDTLGWRFENFDTLVCGIVGIQATWMFTEHLGLTAYGEGQFGQDMDLEINGNKFGTLEGTAFEAGLSLTFRF